MVEQQNNGGRFRFVLGTLSSGDKREPEAALLQLHWKRVSFEPSPEKNGVAITESCSAALRAIKVFAGEQRMCTCTPDGYEYLFSTTLSIETGGDVPEGQLAIFWPKPGGHCGLVRDVTFYTIGDVPDEKLASIIDIIEAQLPHD